MVTVVTDDDVLHRLAAVQVTKKEKKQSLRTFGSNFVAEKPMDKLHVEVECWLPAEVTARDLDKKTKALIVAQLIKQLKAEHLKNCKTDIERLTEGREFLLSEKGKIWMNDWFRLEQLEPVEIPNEGSRSDVGVAAPPDLTIATSTARVQSDTTLLVATPTANGFDTVGSPKFASTTVDSAAEGSSSVGSPTTSSPIPHYDAPTIICSSDMIEAVRAAQRDGARSFQENDDSSKSAFCTNCWTIHRPPFGGFFIPMDPTNFPGIVGRATRGQQCDEDGEWKRLVKNVGGIITVGGIALLLLSVSSQRPKV